MELARHRLPEVHGIDLNRHFRAIAVLLANPAPVAARLLARHASLLAHEHRDASIAQEPRGRDADDSGAMITTSTDGGSGSWNVTRDSSVIGMRMIVAKTGTSAGWGILLSNDQSNALTPQRNVVLA
jgi:hypothetical protein